MIRTKRATLKETPACLTAPRAAAHLGANIIDRQSMKKGIAVVLGLLGLAVMAFSIFGYLMFGSEAAMKHEALQIARSLDDARLSRLADDCIALLEGRPLIPIPRSSFERMWDETSGYPSEFRDLRPIKVIIAEDSVFIVTYQCFDEDVTLEVRHLKTGLAQIVLRHGDYQPYEYETLWSETPI